MEFLMRCSFWVIIYLLTKPIFCNHVEPEEMIKTIEKVGITTGIFAPFGKVDQHFNGAERVKRQDRNHLQNANLINCKNTIKNLTTAFRRKIANNIHLAGSGDNTTLATAKEIDNAIRDASHQLEEECARRNSINMPVEATGTQFLTTEVKDMGADGLVIYQFGIQRLEFEDPYDNLRRP